MSTTEIAAPPDTGQLELVEAATLSSRRRRWVPLPRWARRLGGPLLLLAVWQLLGSLGVASAQVLAPPSAVVRAAWQLAGTGELGANLLASLVRAGEGLAVGV
ncbi:MAG TPA: ABC transporter permease, partial [Pseudonocardiaceae bacterium]|nr:ABC transporter permease [Pseudonocardiaceae bacterium]